MSGKSKRGDLVSTTDVFPNLYTKEDLVYCYQKYWTFCRKAEELVREENPMLNAVSVEDISVDPEADYVFVNWEYVDDIGGICHKSTSYRINRFLFKINKF